MAERSKTAKSTILVTSLAVTGSLVDPRFIDAMPVSCFGIGVTSDREGIAEDDVDRTSRVHEDPGEFEISDYKVNNERTTVMKFIDSASFFFLECDCVVRDDKGWRLGRLILA